MLVAINAFHGAPVLVEFSTEQLNRLIVVVAYEFSGDDYVQFASSTGAVLNVDVG